MNDAVPNRSRLKRAADGFLSAAAALAIWQAVVSIGQMPRFILPGPLDVLHALVANAGLIAENAAATIGEVLGGLVLGSAVGIATAIGLMMSPLAQRLVMPVMVFSQAIPIFALAPILTLWLGYGPASKIAVTVLMIFFPVVSTFFDGMRRTETGLIDAAEILGAGRMAILFRIRIPSAFPSLASGLSLAAVYAPIGAVVGEWVGASRGLGYLMLLANGRAKVDLMFACLFVLAAFTMLLHGLVSHFARKLAAWPKKAA
ncbi:ABC transporter permease subunit [Brucella sp. 10RB9214]|uniref:ABC transporter permease n=1 Tax=unclassified Brucella TaxID=2632610 RepID=UPI000972888F|nr:ABC transporter permease [Brucella sp. 09RB8910]APY13602.1 ABC transporter permease [Brucella sp. 09RB8910]MRN45126.1 ABC transporter permease subunit [Brucella sp. 10RB9212]MRN49205.1 ABC transporter permease subunit [Brucella sp. 10RB9214]